MTTSPIYSGARSNASSGGDALLIVGASARAAAQSARRAGLRPYAVDMFGDSDLVAACETAIRLDDFPSGVARACQDLPEMPWMYVGGMENYPELVDRIANQRQLLGNPGDVLRSIRDPLRLVNALHSHGLPSARIALVGERPPREGKWLLKSRRSSAGRGIRRWSPGDAPPPEDAYFQEFIDGESQSAVFVAARGEVVLTGVTKQLVGSAWLRAPEFGYCGSIGPLPLSHTAEANWRKLGDVLAKVFSLEGIFGVDAIACGGRIVPVEVNPRYTASVEVIESVHRSSAIEWHVGATRRGLLPFLETAAVDSLFFGKAVLYAQDVPKITEAFLEAVRPEVSGELSFGDIPAVGEPLFPGGPILSILSRNDSLSEVETELRRAAYRLEQLLTPPTAL